MILQFMPTAVHQDTRAEFENALAAIVSGLRDDRSKSYEELTGDSSQRQLHLETPYPQHLFVGISLITDNITFDKLMSDIDLQIEVLNAIAADNPILNEQLRLLLESREMMFFQEMEMQRLEGLIDQDELMEHTALIDQQTDDL